MHVINSLTHMYAYVFNKFNFLKFSRVGINRKAYVENKKVCRESINDLASISNNQVQMAKFQPIKCINCQHAHTSIFGPLHQKFEW